MSRPRIRFHKVTNSPNTSKEVLVADKFGKPAIKRHGVSFDNFSGVKPPKDVTKGMLFDLFGAYEILKEGISV